MTFFFFMNNIGYIFIVRRLGKQSKLILSRSDSISNLELNLRIHGPCGPDAHAGADLQAFLFFCFKSILFSAHKLILLIYGDNKWLIRRLGYYWPTILEDCFKYYKGCQACQRFGKIQIVPASMMNPTSNRGHSEIVEWT